MALPFCRFKRRLTWKQARSSTLLTLHGHARNWLTKSHSPSVPWLPLARETASPATCLGDPRHSREGYLEFIETEQFGNAEIGGRFMSPTLHPTPRLRIWEFAGIAIKWQEFFIFFSSFFLVHCAFVLLKPSASKTHFAEDFKHSCAFDSER